MDKKKKLRKNKYKTPEKRLAKKRKISFSFKPFLYISGVFVCIALFSATLVFSYSWITQTSLLETKQIEISGLNRLSDADILKQANLKFGLNIFGINLSIAQQRLLAHPWVKKAELFRMMPDKIQIVITEHNPLATIEFDRKYLMNKEGIIFMRYSDSFKKLPVIAGLLPEDINIYAGDEIRAETVQHTAVMEILKIQKNTFSRISGTEIHKIKVDRELGLTLLSYGKLKEVKLGFNDYSKKLAKLEKVVEFVNKNDDLLIIKTIDLIDKNRIVIKPANNINRDNISKNEAGGYHAST